MASVTPDLWLQLNAYNSRRPLDRLQKLFALCDPVTLTFDPKTSQRAPLPFGLWSISIILVGDRGTCVWTICPRSLHESGVAGSQTVNSWSQVWCLNHLNQFQSYTSEYEDDDDDSDNDGDDEYAQDWLQLWLLMLSSSSVLLPL